MTTNRKHAVVLGGSVAGLFAARVLADTYDHVTIVERDLLPLAADHRRGVPQSRHVHGLLPRGRQIAEELLPGLTDELASHGALVGDVLANVRWFLNGQRLRQATTGLLAVAASRPLIESTIRRRVLARPNVTLVEGHDIVGLSSSPERERITGVYATSRLTLATRYLPADLVVDATGRGSRVPRWLFELGYAPPPEDTVHIGLTYTSLRCTEPSGFFGDDIVIATARQPGILRSSVMQRLEDGSILVTLGGVLGERPPADMESCREYAAALTAPVTHELLSRGTPLGDPVQSRVPTYVRRRYDELTSFPAGLLVTGDAVCSLNPVYAQGMSLAAIDAQALAGELAASDEPRYAPYFAAVAQANAAAWGLSVGADMALGGLDGPALPPSPLTPGYMRSLQLGAVEDDMLAQAFLRVTSLVDPPPALLHPTIATRVAERVG